MSSVFASRRSREALLIGLHRMEESRDLKMCFCFSTELRQLQMPLRVLHKLAFSKVTFVALTCLNLASLASSNLQMGQIPIIPLSWSFFMDFLFWTIIVSPAAFSFPVFSPSSLTEAFCHVNPLLPSGPVRAVFQYFVLPAFS